MNGRDAAALVTLVASLQNAPAPAPPAPFRAETRLVVLRATVKNARGVEVSDLDQSAFRVFEDGRRQPITLFRRDDIPVSLGLVIDNSGSMRPLRASVEAAALALVRASNPDDEVFVLNFADAPKVDVPMTSDIRRLERGIARVDSIGGTALRDAVTAAENYLHVYATRDRHVLLVITDGKDNASVATMQHVQEAADRGQAAIYAIGLFGGAPESASRQGRHELNRLTERTGGTAFYPARVEEIDGVAMEIARQIRNQYTIAYTPTNQARDGTYRRIRVDAAGPEHLVVHTRPGYLAR